MTQMKAPVTTPSQNQGQPTPNTEAGKTSSSIFISLVVDMSWRLAIAVLVPIIGGYELDKVFKTAPILFILGFVIAGVGTVFVLRRSMKVANSLPVPKLTAEQKKAIQKQYEEDDK